MPRLFRNLNRTCKIHSSYSKKNHLNFAKNCTNSKNPEGNEIKVTGVLQPQIGKIKFGFNYELATEFGLFQLGASDELSKLFNSHQWEEFIIKGILVGSVIRVKTAKLKHRPIPYIEDFSQFEDSIIYEKAPSSDFSLEVENGVA